MWWHIHRIVVSVAVLLPMQQFYISKMIMSIFSIIVTCPYIYSLCLVYQVLKNTYFKEYLSVVASKYYICDKENNTQEFKLFKCSPNGKCVIYGTNGIKPQWEKYYGTNGIYPMVHRPNGKGMVYERFFIKVVIVKIEKVMLKD